jgi:phosphomannomutase/phosphoglucomutase
MKPTAFSMKSPGALMVPAALLLAAAVWFGWTGWTVSASTTRANEAASVRTAVAAEVGDAIEAARARLEATRVRIALGTALQREDLTAARDIVTSGWTGVETVEWHDASLDAAYADPQAFGFGKLGLLEQAMQKNTAEAAVVLDGGAPKLGLAAPVVVDGRVLSLVYVRLPVDVVTAPVAGASLPSGYVALRQGQHTVLATGDTTLERSAEQGAVKVGSTPMRVVAASPMVAGGGSAAMSYGLAAACVLAALFVLALPRLRSKGAAPAAVPGAIAEEDHELTLAELERSGKIAKEPTPQIMVAKPLEAAAPRAVLDRSIFRAYDIRGVVGKTLDAETARLIGQAIGSLMQEQGAKAIVVGRDGRLSSPTMTQSLIEGLRATGREVIDIGEAPTPVTYFGAYHLRAGSCVSVTGSHNPPDYNGFKIVVEGETLAGDAIQALYSRIAENRLYTAPQPGLVSKRDIGADYIDRIAGDIQIERKLKVVVDCGSGIAGLIAPKLLAEIGADVETLYCEVDGNFPHHHPDPSDPHNLQDLMNVVKRTQADLGIAFDGDGDRLGVVTAAGEMIYPDRLLMLFAADVLERNPGACVIYDVKCTGHLSTHILRHGGSPLMWKTGHSLIKAKMRETEAELAGEMSGHFFFRERWYGFDDGMYAAARLLEILSSRAETPQEVFDTLPRGVSTPELKIQVTEGEQYTFVEKFLATAKFEGARISTIDGLRADWPDGWGLVRASNTTPVLVLRFDAKDPESLERIKTAFREQLLLTDPSLTLPF